MEDSKLIRATPVAQVKKLANCSIIDSTGYPISWEDLPDGTELFIVCPNSKPGYQIAKEFSKTVPA